MLRIMDGGREHGSDRARADEPLVNVRVKVPAEALRLAQRRAHENGDDLDEVIGLALALYALGMPLSGEEGC